MNNKDMVNENQSYRETVVMEMLSYYFPTPDGQTADLELTSSELADRFSETVEMTPDQIAILMAKAGFHVALRGSKFYWQMSNV